MIAQERYELENPTRRCSQNGTGIVAWSRCNSATAFANASSLGTVGVSASIGHLAKGDGQIARDQAVNPAGRTS